MYGSSDVRPRHVRSHLTRLEREYMTFHRGTIIYQESPQTGQNISSCVTISQVLTESAPGTA